MKSTAWDIVYTRMHVRFPLDIKTIIRTAVLSSNFEVFQNTQLIATNTAVCDRDGNKVCNLVKIIDKKKTADETILLLTAVGNQPTRECGYN